MRLDYSPPDSTARPPTRRSFLIAILVLVSIGAVMSREGTASRAPALPQSAPATEIMVHAPAGPDIRAVETTGVIPWITVKVKPGQTLSQIFDSHGLAPSEWMRILDLGGDTRRLLRLRAGDRIQLHTGPEGLLALHFTLDELRTLHVRRTGNGFEAETIAAEIERRPTYATGSVTSSLFHAGLEAGLSDRLIMEMAEIFGYDIDFGQDLRVGDRFSVIYDELYKDGERLREGSILAAEFVNQGRAVRAVRYVDPNGRAGYFAPEGQSLHRQFLRNPLDVARITSGFTLARRHPILNTIRAHRGVDYGAPTGTPVKATGDGRVAFRGVKGGYGNLVILRHGASYETLYAHLSRFRNGLVIGSRVRQGEVIGYVGSTGLATAPHLHYEFRINGVHKNPRTVALPRASDLPRQYLDHFRASAQPLLAQLDVLNRSQLAQLN
jgi:murein DD-endopeptidase MepM/ murein hydrolase activator NlpD